jgi:SM-20-related protein
MRLLRSNNNLGDIIAEVPPTDGTLLVFSRSDNSWHGFQPFVGERRVVQVNWYVSNINYRVVMARHYVSAYIKKFTRSSPRLASDRVVSTPA